MSLSAKQRASLTTGSDEDKARAAAKIMVETPLWFIEKILLKHEAAVFDVIKELHDEIAQLKAALKDAYARLDAK